MTVHIDSKIVFSFIMSFAVWVAITMTGQTTIEFYSYKRKAKNIFGNKNVFNDYDLGVKKNWELIFGKGKYSFSWLLPNLNKPLGDGIHWMDVKQAFLDELV
eukprot:snap_masked-scaffold_7-processed-gene-13.32-mRNA-1 protein AED:0.67 eAED:0.67 QI:0/0/0/1/1/1/2/0/101